MIAFGLLAVEGAVLIHATGQLDAYLRTFNMYGEEISDPLIYVEITPRNKRAGIGESLKLSVEGIYTSKTVPISGDWFKVEGNQENRIDDCRNTETCEVEYETPGLKLVKTSVLADEELTDFVRIRVEK
jgi:hypothetical protein|tara:strand:+ start:3961 stop:4347 length:387 start_codon:yes stop_codon:yes gene_type:complete